MCLLIHEDDCSYIIKGTFTRRQRGNRIVTEKFEAKWIGTNGRAGNYFPARRTVHTHRRFKITLPNTDQAHEKYL